MTVPRSTAAVVASTLDELRMVVLAQRGDTSARDELARRCQRTAYVFALQLTGKPEDALDLAQESMLRFFSSLGRFDSSRPVRPWLLKIVRNLVRDRARRQRTRPAGPLELTDRSQLAEPADLRPDPEAWAASRQLQRAVWSCLHALPGKQREILALRDYLDLSYDEIATTLGIPRGTVMSRLHRARKQLAAAVRRRLSEAREVNHG